MTKAQHTPGPWKVDEEIDVCTEDGKTTIVVCCLASDREEMVGNGVAQANARLIAAAPELLEAFKLAHEFLDSLPNGWLAKTSGDVGALNDFYIKSHAILIKTKGE